MFTRSRRRLTYLFTLPMGLILIAFSSVIYFLSVEEQVSNFDKELLWKAKEIAQRAKYHQEEGKWDIHYRKLWHLSRRIKYICWYDRFGRLLYWNSYSSCSLKLSVSPGLRTIKSNDSKLIPKSLIQKFHFKRELTLKIEVEKKLIAYLQVSTPLNPLQQRLARDRFFLSLGIPITLGLIGIVGWYLGGLAMQPTKRSYEQLQRFTADASHELRAPVAAILSNAQVGLLAPENNIEQPRQRLENIVDISKTMSTLISNLLFLARHEGKLNPQDLHNVEIVDLLQELANQYDSAAKTKALKFVTDFPSQSVKLKADAELLRYAIKNLLDNAFKYTPQGGSIKLRLTHQSRRVLIQVEDTGIGIPPENLSHIFERFYRVDTSRTRNSGGFGLGLAIVQQIIQAHDGEISVNSTVGKGTTFQITLCRQKNLIKSSKENLSI